MSLATTINLPVSPGPVGENGLGSQNHWQHSPTSTEQPFPRAHRSIAPSDNLEGSQHIEPNLSQKSNGVHTLFPSEKSSAAHLVADATTMALPKVPPSGVWAPAITFFDHSTDTLDTEAQAKFYGYLSKTGLAGLVVLGTNAETFLLTREERKALLQTARNACGPSYPIMAGVGGHSTKQVLEFIADAADAGANYVLLLPPAYFGKQTTPAVIDNFFDDVTRQSPLPIVIYNFPAVCNGIDLDSATIASLARKHSNIVGVKLTCGAVAKITRLAAEFAPEEFAVFGGQSDFLIGGLVSGSAGTIAGFANVFPKTIVRIYELYKEGKFHEAMELHKKAALAEQPCKAGIATVKYAVAVYTAKKAGIEGAFDKLKPRRPYIEPSGEAKKVIESQTAPLASIEASL